MYDPEYLVVGSGLTGATIARQLYDAGHEVLVVERRAHLGGNVYDYYHSCGIRVHAYGPHYFRTSSDRVWQFCTRFAKFYRYEAVIKSKVDGEFQNWPIAHSYIERTVGVDWQPEFLGNPENFEEAALSLMPRQIYEKFVKEYNEKQWGVSARELDSGLCRRFDVRSNDDPRLKPNERYQGIPENGYAEFMRSIMRGIPVILNYDYLRHPDGIQPIKLLVFTGPIDEFFNFDIGRLKYRGQRRSHSYLPDTRFALPCGQVNFPQHLDGPHIRTLEWKHMLPREIAKRIDGTVLTTETPFAPKAPDRYEYPFPDKSNAHLYEKYRERANALPNVLICGRLGEYRYYDMDQAIERAMMLADRILEE